MTLTKYFADLDDYHVDADRKLGEGAFGKVFAGYRISDRAPVAVKLVTVRSDDTKSFLREVTVPGKIKHPAVLELYGFRPPMGGRKAVLITPLMKGSIQDYLECVWKGERPKFAMSRVQIAKAMYGLASALSFMHEHGVLHRDVKPGNVLLDQELRPKLADFGFSRKVSSVEEEAQGITMTNNLGTPIFMAPELFGEGEYTDKVDVYAFAVTYLFSMAKKFPRTALDNTPVPAPDGMVELLIAIHVGVRFARQEGCSDAVWELICECWDGNPDARPSMKEVVERMHSPEFALDPDAVDEYMEYVNWVDGQEQSYTHSRPPVELVARPTPTPTPKPKVKPYNFGV